MSLWIVVSILAQLQPSTRNQRNVHRPRWIAHPNFTLSARGLEHFRSQANGATTTRSLNRANASSSGGQSIGPDNKLDQALYKIGVALGRYIRLGLLLIYKLMLSQSNSIKHGAIA